MDLRFIKKINWQKKGLQEVMDTLMRNVLPQAERNPNNRGKFLTIFYNLMDLYPDDKDNIKQALVQMGYAKTKRAPRGKSVKSAEHMMNIRKSSQGSRVQGCKDCPQEGGFMHMQPLGRTNFLQPQPPGASLEDQANTPVQLPSLPNGIEEMVNAAQERNDRTEEITKLTTSKEAFDYYLAGLEEQDMDDATLAVIDGGIREDLAGMIDIEAEQIEAVPKKDIAGLVGLLVDTNILRQHYQETVGPKLPEVENPADVLKLFGGDSTLPQTDEQNKDAQREIRRYMLYRGWATREMQAQPPMYWAKELFVAIKGNVIIEDINGGKIKDLYALESPAEIELFFGFEQEDGTEYDVEVAMWAMERFAETLGITDEQLAEITAEDDDIITIISTAIYQVLHPAVERVVPDLLEAKSVQDVLDYFSHPGFTEEMIRQRMKGVLDMQDVYYHPATKNLQKLAAKIFEVAQNPSKDYAT